MKGWSYFKNKLPEDGQKITVFDSAKNKEFERVFYINFWAIKKRVLFCSQFCYRWKPTK